MLKMSLVVVLIIIVSITVSFGQNNNCKNTLKTMVKKSGSIDSYHTVIEQSIQMQKQRYNGISDSI